MSDHTILPDEIKWWTTDDKNGKHDLRFWGQSFERWILGMTLEDSKANTKNPFWKKKNDKNLLLKHMWSSAAYEREQTVKTRNGLDSAERNKTQYKKDKESWLKNKEGWKFTLSLHHHHYSLALERQGALLQSFLLTINFECPIRYAGQDEQNCETEKLSSMKWVSN